MQGPGPHFAVYTSDYDLGTGETWCPDCRRAVPAILDALAERKGSLLLIQVITGARHAQLSPIDLISFSPVGESCIFEQLLLLQLQHLLQTAIYQIDRHVRVMRGLLTLLSGSSAHLSQIMLLRKSLQHAPMLGINHFERPVMFAVFTDSRNCSEASCTRAVPRLMSQ